MKNLWNWCLIVIGLFIGHSLSAQPKEQRVLFVGNSYTYFWNMPQLFSAMAESQGKAILTRQSTAGGASLKDHWDGEKELNSQEIITNGSWDIVVLQNFSLSSIDSPEQFMEYGKKFIELVKDNGAQPLLYVTWAREFNPLMQEQITAGYAQLSRETGAKIVPVGPIWQRVRQLRPDLKLYDTDGSHPSPVGTYLIATVFYAALTGESTAKISNRLISTDRDGEKLYLSIMWPNDADFLQQVVDEYFQAKK